MAQLGTYYGLCPLIDQRNLLGVSKDIIPDCVIVTLSRNIAIKYNLSNQKQLHSWSSKEKMSSPVVYDKTGQRYVAIFNQYFVRVWSNNDRNLDNVKKLKFPIALHTIVPCQDELVVIFKNGSALTLADALNMRKTIINVDLIDKFTTIKNQTCVKVDEKYYVGLLLKSKNTYSFLWTSTDIANDEEHSPKARIIQLSRSGIQYTLNGHLAMVSELGPILFTLWSDGRLYSYSLNKEENCEEPCGSFYSVIESLSREHPVRFLALNQNYIAMYGADSNQEGASLQIYNIQFRVTQAKQQFKLFTEGLQLWLINSNNIMLTVAQNLAIIPFHLATEQLAALVGSHKLVSANEDDDVTIVTEMIVDSWDTTSETSITRIKTVPNISLKSQVMDLIKEGWSESAICEEIFPKLFHKKDTKSILNTLDFFTDISEKMLLNILSYTLELVVRSPNNDIINNGLQNQTGKLLDKILTVPYNDVLLLSALRTELKFEFALTFIQYLCYILGENGHSLPGLDVVESEGKVIDWGCLVLDAHYQKFLLAKDTKLVENLEYFKALADTYMLCLDDYKKVEPVLTQLKNKKGTTKSAVNPTSMKYSIENLNLY